ncbi:MAG: hypothetical protein EXQ95_03835 [Alphaproteobacteria bacterium]|nr:hypothetical protein [Alphaproteobacteria bacterium]
MADITHDLADPRPQDAAEEKKDSGRKTTRVQLELMPQSMERLKRLREMTEAVSYAEVLKNALRLYEALIEEADAGNKFQVRAKDGSVTSYKIFGS